MELSFTELEDTGNTGNTENYNTYYNGLIQDTTNTQQTPNHNFYNDYDDKSIPNNIHLQKPIIDVIKKTQKPRSKKKTVSYDDILSSMNTVVIDGKLEFIRKNNLPNIREDPQQTHQKKTNFL